MEPVRGKYSRALFLLQYESVSDTTQHVGRATPIITCRREYCFVYHHITFHYDICTFENKCSIQGSLDREGKYCSLDTGIFHYVLIRNGGVYDHW